MSEETTGQATTEAPAPAETQEATKEFSFDAWVDGNGSREDLPSDVRKVHDHFKDHYEKRDSFNAVKELRSLIDQADSRAGASANNRKEPSEPTAESEIERRVQERINQTRVKQKVDGFRSNFESMVKEPISVGEGHSFAFSSKKELETFVEFSRNVLNSGQITPHDLYKLWNFDRILADTGEWNARKHEESLRKVSAGGGTSREEPSTDTKSTQSKRGERREDDRTVEEIMKDKFPDVYGDMVSGNVRFG